VIALDSFCQRVLSEIQCLASDTSKTSHERYLAVYSLLEQRRDELAQAFDDPRRSTAVSQLAYIQSHRLLTDEEISRFSPKTRETVQFFLEPGDL
jgi:hypothetical protein